MAITGGLIDFAASDAQRIRISDLALVRLKGVAA
jgi:hypothetical protein